MNKFIVQISLAFAICLACLSLSANAWEPPKIKPDELSLWSYSCAFKNDDWYTRYLDLIGVDDNSYSLGYRENVFKNGEITSRYPAVETILVQAESNSRAQLILALEQFVESARLKHIIHQYQYKNSVNQYVIDWVLNETQKKDRSLEDLKLQAEILLGKAINNAESAANKGSLDATVFLSFWELIGVKETPHIRQTLQDLWHQAKKGSAFSQALYIDYRRQREWSFFLEAAASWQEGDYSPMGYPKCNGNLSYVKPKLFTKRNGERFGFDNSRRDNIYNPDFWSPLDEGFKLYVNKKPGYDSYNLINSTCTHIIDKIKSGNAPARSLKYLVNNPSYCQYDQNKLTTYFEDAVKSGDPTTLNYLAKIYIEDADPSNDVKALNLLKLNTDSQPLWSRQFLMGIYSAVLPDPKSCLETASQLLPYYDELSEIDPELGFKQISEIPIQYWRNSGVLEISISDYCASPDITVNSSPFKLSFSYPSELVLRFETLSPAMRKNGFINVKGKAYTPRDPKVWGDVDYSDHDQYSKTITGSIYVGELH